MPTFILLGGGEGHLLRPPPLPDLKSMPENGRKSAQIHAPNGFQNELKIMFKKFLKRNANLEAILQAPCMNNLRERYLLIV